jgi:hypothetical protein
VDNIRRGVENLSTVVYCKPVNNAVLGKRTFMDISPSKIDTTFNRLTSQIEEISDSNPVHTAWMIHQVSGNDNELTLYGAEEDGFDESNNVPLHVACGYLDDILCAYPDLLENPSDMEALKSPGDHMRSSLPDLEAFGTWPYNNEPFQTNVIPNAMPPAPMYCQPVDFGVPQELDYSTVAMAGSVKRPKI